MTKILINAFLILLLVMSFPLIAFSEEIYEYERAWPVLEQPWYFTRPNGIAVDSSGNVYIADTENQRIQKFTPNGQFVTKWGSSGSESGQFGFPSGIAVDSSGNVYVADTNNHRIQKFTPNGQFTARWGSSGSGNGQFSRPSGIALDNSGNVYVADTWNHRIQKFTSNGQFTAKWGSYGSGDGQFGFPSGIALDNNSNVYVAGTLNYRIQKFTPNGQFAAKWGSEGNGDGQFNNPFGIAVDSSGNVYVADTENQRIQKFTNNGGFVTKWGSEGSEDGQFFSPQSIALDSSGNVYVADTNNHRIQKFKSNGQFIAKWGSVGSEDGQFDSPYGIAVDSSGNVYVADTENCRIQKFTTDGEFVTKWGSYGSEDGQFDSPYGIAVDNNNYVYVTDVNNYRVQKFTTDGEFITAWGSESSGDGQFYSPNGIAVDSSGNVYVADTENQRIQKFTTDGEFITKWGSEGDGDKQFYFPQGIAVDSSDNVYVADTENHRIQKFTSNGEFVTKWGSSGNNVGEFSYEEGIAIGSDGKVYVSDTGNNRIQVFGKVTTKPLNNKAIIVAGGGPFKGNNLWDATQMNANFAYRTLISQGFTNDTIYYLSSDRNVDLSGDGIPDVDADATNSSLHDAITQWAKDADSLVVYLIDHGGPETFRMSEAEVLEAEDLASWLNELQETMQGLMTVIYDACESGSFVSKLVPPSERQRITITSTSPGESAYFLNTGTLSFSYMFWSQVFGGGTIYWAYVMAKDGVGVVRGTEKDQNPQIDGNGNGIGNEKADGDVAKDKYIGKGFTIAGDIPVIGTISQDQILSGQTSATITVENIVTTGRITRVWAIVHSPDFTITPDNPITDLPTFDLTWNEQNRRYEGTYNGFTVMGTYTVTVYATNEEMIVSLPKTTKVEQTQSQESISAPNTPSGPTSGFPNTNYTYFTGGSSSSLGHSIRYRFDWGDGTYSDWLVVGTTSPSKNWDSEGTYSVRAQAQCSIDPSVVSGWSNILTVTISKLILQSPLDGASFGACSLLSPPTFSWLSGESFKGYQVQFSSDNSFSSIPVKVKASATQVMLSSSIWKKVLMIPGTSGGTVYWRVVGSGTTVKSGVRSFGVEPAEAVLNPILSSTSKSFLPTLSWENNCGMKFKVWFGSDESFTKKVSYALSIKNPNDNGGLFSKGLTSGQWKAIRKLVNDATGSTIFWYVESTDGLNRKSSTGTMNFTLMNE